MGLGQPGVQLDGLQRCFLHERHRFQRRPILVLQHAVRLRLADMRLRVARVFPNGLLEELQGGRGPLLGPPLEGVDPLQVGLVRFGGDVAGRGERGLVLRGQLKLDLRRDVACKCALHDHDFLPRALVAVRPQVLVALAVNELGRDPNAVTGTEDRSLEDGVHVELPGDLRQRLVRALVAHDRRGGDDLKRADA